MLKFFFNRESLVVTLMEFLGITAYIFFLRKYYPSPDLMFWLLNCLFISYAFVRFCDLFPWHKAPSRDFGIRVHFQKVIVPTAYIISITSILCLARVPYVSMGILILANIMMIVMIPVNVILVYFYLKDKDPLPINYFSSNAYLKEWKGHEI